MKYEEELTNIKTGNTISAGLLNYNLLKNSYGLA
jgi:hypothetical protein